MCSQNQQEVQITESEQVWRSLIDEGEDVVPLSSVDSSLSNLEVFCYARLAFILLTTNSLKLVFIKFMKTDLMCFVSIMHICFAFSTFLNMLVYFAICQNNKHAA